MLEVFYAKKDYSFLAGIVDCVSYCLDKKQRHEDGENLSEYEKNIFDIICTLPKELLKEEITGLTVGK